MKILYVTRHFNHSGYLILESIAKNGFNITATVLYMDRNWLRNPIIRVFHRYIYLLKCKYYRGKLVKNFNSEESLCRKYKIPVIWTKSIKSDSFYKELEKNNPDIIVLGGGWHELIPKRVFSYPKYGCINTHPSLLPEFRGTSITRWQILNGVKKSGSTIHYVNDRFDAGGILEQKSTDVNPNITPQELFYHLAEIGAQIMPKLLNKFINSGIPESYYAENNTTYYNYYKKWTWDQDKLIIDWNTGLDKIHYFVMANYQESFEYKGPIFYYKNNVFFLRQTKLKPLNALEICVCQNLIPNKLYGKYEKNILNIYRKGEFYCLQILLIQKYDNFFKYRRAKTPKIFSSDYKNLNLVNFEKE